jgi:hypothetical protein
MLSALGLRGPTSASRRRGTRSCDSIAFKLPWRVANMKKALVQTAALGIWG